MEMLAHHVYNYGNPWF